MFTCLFIYKQFTSVNKYKDIKTLSLKAEKIETPERIKLQQYLIIFLFINNLPTLVK